MRDRIALALIGSVISTIAVAQRSPDVEQISASRPTVAIPEIKTGRSTGAAQLSPPRDAVPAPAQLSSKADLKRQTTQVATGHRDVRPPSPLSSPADGRLAAVDLVAGTDQCDPAASKKKRPVDCNRVIETRAVEFARPAPTELSPEQKLLLEQQINQAGEGVVDATRRLARSGSADNSSEAAAIATVVLGTQQPPQKPKDEDQPANDATLQAVINSLLTPK